MNYRLILLDYYYQYLKEQGVTSASFCYLDRHYKNNLSKFYFDESKINVFHLKAPRVFNKTYEYKNSTDSILDFVLENTDDVVLEYENIDSYTKDVYYLKPIKNIPFKYLHIKYINIDEAYSGVMFLYSDSKELNLSIKDASKLFKNILKDEEDSLVYNLNQLIVDNTSTFLMEDVGEIYLSDALKDNLSIQGNYYTKENAKYEQVVKKVNRFKELSKVKSEEKLIDKSIIFYDTIKETINLKINSLSDLKINKPNDHFTIIYLENKSYEDFDYSKYVMLIKEIFGAYFIDDFTLYDTLEGLLILIPSLIELSVLEKIKNNLTKHEENLKCEYLNTAYHLNKNVDLVKVVDYFKENDTFTKVQFKEFLNLKQEGVFLGELNIIKKSIYNSYDEKLQGAYFGYNHLDLLNKQKSSYYLASSNIVLEEVILNNEIESVFMRITYDSFKSKKIWYKLNKINAANKMIILSEVVISSQKELDRLIEIIHHLHELHFEIYFDSSIYSKIMMSDLINLYEGIYVEDYEIALGYLEEENLFQSIIVFYLKQNKKIILNQDKSEDFEHPNVYFIK